MGFCISRHPECPRPQWGFHFLDKKTTDPGRVLHFPTPWIPETPVGISFFGQKNTRPRWGFAFPDTLNAQDPSGDCIFWTKKHQTPVGFCISWHPKSAKHTLYLLFLNKKTQTTPCSLLSQTPWKSETHPVSSIFLTKKCQLHPVVCYLRYSESARYTLYLLFF